MAFALGNKPLAGYPQPRGSKYKSIFDHTGPASYTQFTSPSTGGDVINASDIGAGGIERIALGTDSLGKISSTVILNLAGYANAVPSVIITYTSLVTATLGGQSQTAGTQIAAATDLSGFSWRAEADVV